MGSRLLLDVSSLARWTGPPVGIARVEHALAQGAMQRADTTLCFWDKRERAFRSLRPEWAATVLGWYGAVDIPAPGQSLLSRHRWFSTLERMRLSVPAFAALAGALQDALLSVRRHGHTIRDAAGRRIAHVPPAMVLGEALRLGPEDVLLSAGSDWYHLDAAGIGEAKRRTGFRYACICYDLIPITHPEFYAPKDVAMMHRHWHATLQFANLVVTNATCIAADLERFCAAEQIATPEIAIQPLGYDPPPGSPGTPPPPLESGRYALFVSTIEPRKGHAMLLRVWRRLLARCLPQRHRFHLVFVGRPGWMVEDVLRELTNGAGLEGTVCHLQGIDDVALHALYAHAAFVLYPSRYEGFGLPIIEAFAHGKPVIASTGGALPETVAGAYPCLPPDDEMGWETAIAEWIERPPGDFESVTTHLTWREAAAAILARVKEA
jgi:glycosyltransferase involved in cell wall biosynthesis